MFWPVLQLFILDLGAAFGTAKAGTGISSIAIWRPNVVMKSLIPVVMAGILGIYGMIVAVIISQKGIAYVNHSKEGWELQLSIRLWTYGIRVGLRVQLCGIYRI